MSAAACLLSLLPALNGGGKEGIEFLKEWAVNRWNVSALLKMFEQATSYSCFNVWLLWGCEKTYLFLPLLVIIDDNHCYLYKLISVEVFFPPVPLGPADSRAPGWQHIRNSFNFGTLAVCTCSPQGRRSWHPPCVGIMFHFLPVVCTPQQELSQCNGLMDRLKYDCIMKPMNKYVNLYKSKHIISSELFACCLLGLD